MSILFIGDNHPMGWMTGKYEQRALTTIWSNILNRYRHERCLLVNNTWLEGNKEWEELLFAEQTFDHLFYVSLIDPDITSIGHPLQDKISLLGNPVLHRVGNFDNSEHSFYIFAIMVNDLFAKYTDEELRLTEIKYDFINYNRKPHPHRKQLVDRLEAERLVKNGIVTLGCTVSPKVVNEDIPALDSSGENDGLGIPNDIMTLGNMDYWRHHFLNIVSETESDANIDIFVSEKTFKPMLGMRPFLVNGQEGATAWLEDNGFRTFDHYFPHADNQQDQIIKALHWLATRTEEQKLELYDVMYMDLLHNKARVKSFAEEQEKKLADVLLW